MEKPVLTRFKTPFESLMNRPVEIALSNGEERRGILYLNPPGRLLLVAEGAPLVVNAAAVVGIVATGPKIDDFRPGREQYGDLVDFLTKGVRVALTTSGEWEGILVDVSPMGAEWLGIQKPDGSTVFVPSAAVATVELIP